MRQPKLERKTSRPQMKEQEKSPEKELNEMEASYLSDMKFKVMIIKILNSMKKGHKKVRNEEDVK